MLFIQDRQLKMRRAGAGIVLNGMRESLDRALEIPARTRLLPTMKYGSFCSSCGLGPGGQHPVPNKAKKRATESARHPEKFMAQTYAKRTNGCNRGLLTRRG